MAEHDKDLIHQGTDAEIASRFARLRASEAGSAPPFTREIQPVARKRNFSDAWSGRYALPRLAAAAVLVFAVFITLLHERAEEDPARLYTDIMSHQQFETDGLLELTDGEMPALKRLPTLYDPGIELDPDSYAN